MFLQRKKRWADQLQYVDVSSLDVDAAAKSSRPDSESALNQRWLCFSVILFLLSATALVIIDVFVPIPEMSSGRCVHMLDLMCKCECCSVLNPSARVRAEHR